MATGHPTRPTRALARLPSLLPFALIALIAGSASAAEPTSSVDNACTAAGGRGEVCAGDADCAQNLYAVICVAQADGSGLCEAPCADPAALVPTADPTACAIGETCVSGDSYDSAGPTFYCAPGRFRVDLNLLDLCVTHYLDRTAPTFSANECSLERNLNLLLDQTGDRRFDIFDLDLCVLAFLEQRGCQRDLATGVLEPLDPDVTCCDNDEQCGAGVYCDEALNICQRDCGLIASRESTFGALDRRCTGALKVCDFSRGRCESVDVTRSTCQVDRECPAGAYCFLGRCAPNCYRAIDCPDSGWTCSATNTCRALPPPDADEGFTFDPQAYAIRFVSDTMALNGVQSFQSSQLAIMDLITKRQVIGNSSVAFGYRMEITYGLKQDASCLKPFVDCSDANARSADETEGQCTRRQDDCLIDPSEEWIRPVAPFGTVNAGGQPSIRVELEEAVADDLSPGVYPAVVRLIFDNGDSDSIPVVYTKASPSGEYVGNLTVYVGSPVNSLNGNRPLTFGMRLKVYPDQSRHWNELMAAHQLNAQDDIGFVDITEGQLVHGSLHGATALAFTRGGAGPNQPDEIPFVGIYSPDLGRLRIVGVIDIPANFQLDADGGDCGATGGGTAASCVRNLFGRDIRRRIEFFGPFDAAIGRYSGIYRETIFGLVPAEDITLEGGFILDQKGGDDSELPVDGAVGAAPAGFDADFQALDDVTVPAECDGPSGIHRLAFGSKASFDTYMTLVRRRGAATTNNPLGRVSIFPDLVEFNDAIDLGLRALDPAAFGDDPNDPLDTVATGGEVQQAHLNIYDFLSPWVVTCDPNDPSPPPGCIDEADLRCGLALHEKAILKGWVDFDALSTGTGVPAGVTPDAFCLDTLVTDGCPDAAYLAGAGGFDYRDLFALQEHNRFWLNLAQTKKFEGDRARSDAFMVLFRNELDPFAQGSALSYKADALRTAVKRYDEVLELIAGDAAASVLFQWPARSFKQIGNDWLTIMQTVASDRLDAVGELVDLERRVFASTSEADYRYAHHLMQQEYLVQVYLFVLQARWQGELFAYRGEAVPVLTRGQRILSKLNPVKNELGVTANQVFFENGDPAVTNWRAFRSVLVGEDGEGGLVGDARGAVGDAVEQMQSALSDLDSLEESLKDARFDLQDSLNDICGDPSRDTCSNMLAAFKGADGWKAVRDCRLTTGDDVPTDCSGFSDLRCADEYDLLYESQCKTLETKYVVDDVLKAFATETDKVVDQSGDDAVTNGPTCVMPSSTPSWILVDGALAINGATRPCVGGQMGALLQERAANDRERRIVIGSVETLAKQLNANIIAIQEAHKLFVIKTGLDFGLFKPLIDAATVYIEISNALQEAALEAADSVDCTIIAGLAVGTDCPQHIAGSLVGSSLHLGFNGVEIAVNIGKYIVEFARDVSDAELDRLTDLAGTIGDLEAGVRDVDSLIDELNNLTQAAFNLDLQMLDLVYQAQAAADRFSDETLFIAQHLVGRESGNLLTGEALARDGSVAFEDVLLFTYKMTMAFIHHYNLSEGDATNLVAQMLALVTLDDVSGFVSQLDQRERDYCGLSGLDCDYVNNLETLRYSVREQLFPQLRDIVDARTGEVLTAGEQFHNIITSPPYLKRRFRAAQVVDQIELPLPMPITLQDNAAGGPTWLIDPLSCNHKLDARKPNDVSGIDLGTHAVNVVGHNLPDASQGVRYELIRGATDYIRSCAPASIQTEVGTTPIVAFPIHTWTVGYAPQPPNALQDSPPAFFTRGGPFTACTNFEEVGGELEAAPCWRYFARDRALASQDMRMIIPLQVGEANTANAWIAGEGLSEDQRPVIEDIIVYFRYRSRPVQEH